MRMKWMCPNCGDTWDTAERGLSVPRNTPGCGRCRQAGTKSSGVLDETGNIHDHWKVLSLDKSDGRGRRMWICGCIHCGFEIPIRGQELRSPRLRGPLRCPNCKDDR